MKRVPEFGFHSSSGTCCLTCCLTFVIIKRRKNKKKYRLQKKLGDRQTFICICSSHVCKIRMPLIFFQFVDLQKKLEAIFKPVQKIYLQNINNQHSSKYVESIATSLKNQRLRAVQKAILN